MTPSRDEVLRMVREAGMSFEVFPDGYCDAVDVPRGTVSYIDCVSFEHIDRFAVLVIADSLQRTGQYVTNDATRAAVVAEAVAAEREACALAVEVKVDRWSSVDDDTASALQAAACAIRARSTKP